MPNCPSNATAIPQLTGQFICVFGLSGVGKTTLISEFVREHSSWRSLSASSLLREISNQHPEHLRTLSRSEIKLNQLLLAMTVRKRRALVGPSVDWLLDAHSVINNDCELVPVPVEVIAELSPDLLVFIYGTPELILRRRTSDPHRHRPLLSIQQIAEEQKLAFETCLRYSIELQIRLHKVDVNDRAGFTAVLTNKND